MAQRKRRTRRDVAVSEERWRPNLLYLLVTGLLLMLFAALLLKNQQGERLGLPGAYVWVTGLFIAFGLRLVTLSRYVLPPEAAHESGGGQADGMQGWQEGLRMLFYYFSVLAMPESIRSQFRQGSASIPRQVSDSFAEFQAGFVDSHQAIILARGTGFSRAAGPGYVRLNKGERISDVVDLRRQSRRHAVEAVTRDGIPLQTSVSVTFCVPAPLSEEEAHTTNGVPYPYNRDAVFRLTYADGVGTDSEIPWSERICPQAAAFLVAEIARYRLDQLYQPTSAETADVVPLNEIVREVSQQLQEQLLALFDCRNVEECPIEIRSVSVGQLKPPQEVAEQRIINWQSAWQRRIALDEAQSKAHEIKHIQEARAQALTDMIENVTKNVEKIGHGNPHALSKVIMLRMMEMMDRLISARRLRLQTPENVLETLHKTSSWLRELPNQKDKS